MSDPKKATLKTGKRVDREVYLRLCEAVIEKSDATKLTEQEVKNIIARCWYAAADFESWASTPIKDNEE